MTKNKNETNLMERIKKKSWANFVEQREYSFYNFIRSHHN